MIRLHSRRYLACSAPLAGWLAATVGLFVATSPMTAAAAPEDTVPRTSTAAAGGTISGVIRHPKTKERIPNAIVVLQCTCLQGLQETTTNAEGLYAFKDLPPGTYTVQVLIGQADESKVATLPRGAKFRADFAVDPAEDNVVVVKVRATPVEQTTSTGRTVSMEEFRDIPIGGTTSRDFTAVVESSATVSRDSAGLSLAGTTGAESKYVVEGANVNNPSFGTVGASIVQEFIEEVDVQEAGYDAEFGGVSGGQVQARLVSGTNKLRGTARFTYTPRLAKPRFVISTDSAVLATETPDYALQGVVQIAGPIIKDKLFWSAGVNLTGLKSSLTQSFRARVDKPGTAVGYEDCPFENGDNDCIAGGNYIETREFAQQKFRTGGIAPEAFVKFDWVVNPRHRLSLSFRLSPSFNRRTFRRAPAGFDPGAFGTSLNSDPLGGASLTANGVVNGQFGWDRANSGTVALDYLGRVFDDKIEIRAGGSFSQFAFQEAWRLDDPDLFNLTATQETDADGANLFTLLDRDGAVDLVAGVDEACNGPDLPPGQTCPVRRWLSGGVGDYSHDVSRRVEGRFTLTHFFNALGAHQVKYGAGIEHVARHLVARYSGSNESDFYDNCADGQTGGGEWCYDSGNDEYVINNGARVDNHRLIFVDTDNPEARTSAGRGRIRHEQGELRAIATPLGAGARVDRYDENLSTQNYHVFLQDKWAILSNLFISGGVRWDMQDMRDALGERAMFIWDNVAPRVGVVYDWTDEGRSRLFASYGWFYQNLPLQLNSRVFGGLVNVLRTYRNSDCEGRVASVGGDTFFRYDQGQPTEWCIDYNSNTTQLTEGAVVPKLKGSYTQQFQIGYEQEVIEDLTLGIRWLHSDQGRAVEDISTDGGTNFIIANPGEPVSAKDIDKLQDECNSLASDFAALPMDDPRRPQAASDSLRCATLVESFSRVGTLFNKPVRNFDAFTFEVKKRLARNWLLLASYTYSRLIGNYDGFVDPTTGAVNLGASSQYDIPDVVRNSYGPLSFNSPHRLKLDGFYSFDLKEAGRLILGTSFRFQSGYPISLRGGHNRYPGAFPVYVVPRGMGGRVEPNYGWNLSATYSYPLRGDIELEVSARILNVTNARSVLRVDEVYTFQNTRAIAGGDLEDLKHAKVQSAANPTEFYNRTILARQGNFGVERSFQTPLAGQFEVRVRF